jgi:hypothetical protein
MLPEMRDTLRDTRELYSAIDKGDYSRTGPIEGWVAKFNDKETAGLAFKQTLQALKNLQITRLTPVSNFEIQMIEQLYADWRKNPQANLGALEEAAKLLERQIGYIEDAARYRAKTGSVENYLYDQFLPQEEPEIDLSGVPEDE